MARSRNIKPGFCQNEILAELPFETRLAFALLPMFADRDGRMEDRPKRIKMQMFPADNIEMHRVLQELHGAGFIQRYTVDNSQYIQIVNFAKHQNPHVNERPSEIPPPPELEDSTVQAPESHSTNRADSLFSDSFKTHTSTAARFDEWWRVYPKKIEKKKAKATWKRRKLDAIAETLIADTERRQRLSDKWKRGYIPNPTTYLNGDRWEDEIDAEATGPPAIPKNDDACVRFAAERGIQPNVGETMWEFRQRIENVLRAH